MASKIKNSKELGCVFYNGRENQQLKFNEFGTQVPNNYFTFENSL